MQNILYKSFSYILVGMMWGCTNPFLKKGSEKTTATVRNDTNNENKNDMINILKKNLKKFYNPSVLIPFVLNQSGSLLFYFLLATENISITVPVCNSLTFLFTGLTGWFLGEKFTHPFLFVLGLILIICGLSMCALSSMELE